MKTDNFEKAASRIKENAKCRSHVVSKEHHAWVSTDEISQKIAAEYPDLETPWLSVEHVHGVSSAVTGVCKKHKLLIPMLLGNLWRGTTQYGCPECAWEKGQETDIHKRFRNQPGYVGRSGAEFALFCAIKEVFPDAIPGHRIQGRKEIDIWVPSIGCGVEYNGNYYHAEAMGRGRTYHFDKSLLAAQQEKMILHLFSEEAEDLDRVVRTLRLFSELASAYTSGLASLPTLHVQAISRGMALSFHERWSCLIDQTAHLRDVNVGIFDDQFNMVAAVSANRKLSMVTKISSSTACLPLAQVLDWMVVQYQLNPITVRCDMRNPVEWLICRVAVGMQKLIYTEPSPVPLGKKYEILQLGLPDVMGISKYLHEPHPNEVGRAWDCGIGWFCRKGKPPRWLIQK